MMTMANYSTRLGSISDEQFQKALERFGLGDFIQAERIPYGLFGQNVFLTSSKGEFVFRGALHSSWQFPTECFFTNLLHRRTGTPVPYPYWFESTTDVFGWGYVIMPRMPGVTLQDPIRKAQLSVEDRLEIARAVAKMLVEIQTLSWNTSGAFDAETNQVETFKMHYRERVVYSIHEKVEAACSYNRNTTQADVQFIESILMKSNNALYLPFQPTVVLGDYGEHNLVVSKTANNWQVSGVFDLMTAHFWDGAADLSGPVMGYLKKDVRFADAFVQEYLAHKPCADGFFELQQLYMLDLTLSFWRYFQQHEGGLPEDPSKQWIFEHWAKPLIRYWEKYR